MKEKDLKQLLQQPYSLDNWKTLLPLLFGKVDFFTTPQRFALADDRITKGEQVGVIELTDGKSLAIFDVEVADSVHIARNRKELRDIAAKHIDQGIIHGALVFYHSPHQEDYRFSFIAKWSALNMETGELIKNETKPKRYTYLLGPNEACTTAAKRLLALIPKRENEQLTIQSLLEVFSVEALNREFFKTYKQHYEKFWRYLAESPWREALIDAGKEEPEKQEKPIRDFVKKLLGRIVFLHFLQKKGWMGCPQQSNQWQGGEKRFMRMLFEEFTDKEHFYSRCLTKLFFETLNTKRPDDVFYIEGLEGRLNGSRVPYLNGGLFEPEKNEATLRVDFPANYFEELLEFFEQYNFTIDENSPDDHEVGIDPEMLGHIFENLLEENREKGAFYTPKEIVQYMCQESLIQYLYNHFGERKDIDDFIRRHIVSPFLAERDNALKINQLLDEIKVCDPAIGSGAFPIGMLQEIFDAKRHIYPYLNTNKPFDPAAVKKNIIQNSIYGVDIEKGAVDIARLRFWLALVVDEEEPQPLPNLDYKIMQGNSLLEQYEGIDLSKVALFEEPEVKVYQANIFEEPESKGGFSEENRESIKQLVKDYFKAEDKDEKARIHKAIDRIVLDHIDKSLEGFENQLLIEIATLEKRYQAKIERLSESQKAQYDKKSKELKEIAKRQKLLENKTRARQNLLKFEQTDERPYFLWHLYFMDVFEQGGFDIVIGNPPYIQLQKDGGRLAEELKHAGYKTFERTGDIYSLFYEKGIQLLKDNGHLCYITSNKWMRAGYGKSTRAFFAGQNPLKLIDLGSGIFESATVDTNILLIQKAPYRDQCLAADLSREKHIDFNNLKMQPLRNLTADSWTIASEAEQHIKAKIEAKGKPLKEWDVQINYGIKTGYNEAFIINTDKRHEILANCQSEDERQRTEQLIKPLLRGRDIKRYRAEWAGLWLIGTFPALNLDIDDYPSVKAYLEQFLPKIKQTGETYIDENGNKQKTRKRTSNKWFETQDQIAYYKEFEKEKVVWKRIGSVIRFAFDKNGMFPLDSNVVMTGKWIKYLCGYLNSKLSIKQLIDNSPKTGTGDVIISVQALEPHKIPPITPTNEPIVRQIEELVDKILAAKKENKNADTTQWEQQIDLLVYKLYELSYEEVKVVDPSFPLSREEYENFKPE